MEFMLESCYDTLYKYCLMKTKNESVAADITQESFKIYYEHCKNENINEPEHYIFKTAKNLCYKHFNNSKKIVYTEFENLELSVEFNEDIIFTDEDILKYKQKILSCLSPTEGEIIKYYYENKKSIKEISNLLDKSEWNIYKIKKNAEKKIKLNLINLFQK